MTTHTGITYSLAGDGVDIACTRCHTLQHIPNVAAAQIKAWNNGQLIQRAMPDTSNDQRELFITGTCGDCWKAMFGTEEEF